MDAAGINDGVVLGVEVGEEESGVGALEGVPEGVTVAEGVAVEVPVPADDMLADSEADGQ